ncbi:MAG: hypothetical protein V1794_05490 [Candidatus Glassbacteria bacterium]
MNIPTKKLFVPLFAVIAAVLTVCSSREPVQAPAAGGQPLWEILGPGGGGSTFFPTFHPTNPDRIAIRCDMTGIYLSSDGGASWKMHNLPSGTSAFAFEKDNAEVVYVGATGLYRTEDFGGSWQLLLPPAAATLGRRYESDHADFGWRVREGSVYPQAGADVTAILVHPDNPATLYVGLGGRDGAAVYVSTDRGRSWKRAAELDSRAVGLFSAPEEPEAIYAATARTIYRLDPAGEEISRSPLPDELAPANCVAGGWDPEISRMRFYAVGSSVLWGENPRPRGVYVSGDGGQSWERVDERMAGLASIPADQVQQSFDYVATSTLDSRTAYLVCDRFMDKNPRGEVGHWYGIFKTTDAGKSWSWVFREGGGSSDYTRREGWVAQNVHDSWSSQAFGGEFVRVICTGVFPADPEIAVFTDWYRAMKTADGGRTWSALYSETLPDSSVKSRGLDVTTCYGVHFDPFDPGHFAISYTDIAYWHTFDGGRTWRRSVEGIPPSWDNTCYWVQFDPAVKDRLWSAWSSWHDLPKLKMTRIPGWKTGAVGGVAASSDGGRSWKVSSDGLPENAPTTCLLLDPASPAGARTLYAAVYGKGVYRSTDDGATWERKNAGIEEPEPNAWEVVLGADGTLYLVLAFDVIFDGDNRALRDGALYRSPDRAENWQKVALPAGVRFPNSVEADPRQADRLFLAGWASVSTSDYGGRPADGPATEKSEGGVLYSEDGGRSWRQVFDPGAYVYDVTVDPEKPGRVYLNTFMHSAFTSDDYSRTWTRMAGYDFHWGHRVIPDIHHPGRVYLTTFGGSVWHGTPIVK